jgi:hypothetical protein
MEKPRMAPAAVFIAVSVFLPASSDTASVPDADEVQLVTVRPDATVMTRQLLPYYVGISFIPADVPHQPVNLSSGRPARAIVARNDADEQESVVPYDPEDGAP